MYVCMREAMKEAWVTRAQLMNQYVDETEVVAGIIARKTQWDVDECFHPELLQSGLPEDKKMQYFCMIDDVLETFKEDVHEQGYNLQGEVYKEGGKAISGAMAVVDAPRRAEN